MQLSITIDEVELTNLILKHIQDKLGNVDLKKTDIKIEVKSKQNYKSEWETASFRATYTSLNV